MNPTNTSQVSLFALEELTPEPSTSLSAVLPASPSPSRGSKPARVTPVIDGLNLRELCGKSGPLSSVLKTLVGSRIWRSTLYALSWKLSVTRHGRLLFRLQASALPTEGSGSSSWATPQTHYDGRTEEAFAKAKAEKRAKHRRGEYGAGTGAPGMIDLNRQVMRQPWATPTNEDGESKGMSKARRESGVCDNLNSQIKAVATMRETGAWPTPTTTDANSAARHTTTTGTMHSGTQDGENDAGPSQFQRNSVPLNAQVTEALPWATPHAQAGNGAGEHGDGAPNIQTQVGGALNPDWVETLQSLPIGWTRPEGDSLVGPRPEPRWPAPRGVAQYEWEPPRVTVEKKDRRKRLKALGNAVVAEQIFPILQAIVEASR